MNITWNAKDYTDNFSFVHKYGEDVLSLIDAPEKSFVVDLGCGNGALSEKILERGYNVLGIDASEKMLDIARNTHPKIQFIKADATNFSLDQKADVIFSNAVFHWIDKENQPQLAKNISSNLKLGGKLVCEFGGYGCAKSVHEQLAKSFSKRNIVYKHPHYFPTIGEYAPILENAGLQVEFASLFDRPTVQQTENGLVDWIKMFLAKPFEKIDESMRREIYKEAETELRDKLFVNGKWFIDYVRIRIRARKIYEK